MIYCKLKKNDDVSAVYSFGKISSDITGEVEFRSMSKPPIVLKQPKNGNVPERWLAMIAVKYKEQLSKGIFPEKMSYER